MFEMKSRDPEIRSGVFDTKVDTMDLIEFVSLFIDPFIGVAIIFECMGIIGVNGTPNSIDSCLGR